MKQYICIKNGEFYAERKVKKGEIFWVDKFEYETTKKSAMYQLFEEINDLTATGSRRTDAAGFNRYALGLPPELFEKHFILLTEWREKQLNNVLK